MPLSDLWALELLVAAFAGGAFGAAIGALPSFSLAGLMVIVGELYWIVGRTVVLESPPVDITGSIAFGVVLGPHVAFGGGAAALAYATKRNYLETDFKYHQAKEITRGLGSKPDVLVVGGVFGVLGYWIATLSTTVSAPVDPVALGVVVSALAHRLAFGYSIIGTELRNIFDMPAYEGRDTEMKSDGGRPTVEPWLSYQYRWGNVLMLGLIVGILGGYIAYVTASPFLAFGISVVALVFLNAGVPRIPVTHHMSLPASTAVLALIGGQGQPLEPSLVTQTLPLSEALLVGAGFGLIGAVFGEILQRVFYAHAETHLDPPAASIVVTSLLIATLAMLGVFPTSVWIPHP